MGWRVTTDFFDIAADQKRVFAASDFYIPFEIRHDPSEKNAQVRNFKARLCAAIKMLRPQDGEVLFAQYAEDGGKNRFFDLENMLFYNLGASPFADCAVHGISFSSLPDQAALCRQNGVRERKYAYIYQCLPLSAAESRFAALPLMAEWRGVPLDCHEPNRPEKYWKALRRAGDSVTAFDYTESPAANSFALKIALDLPKQVKLANTIKPLLDGVICAFHGEDARCLEYLADFCVRQRCEELSIPGPFPPVLGKRAYIRPYRNGRSFQWDPADDLCKLALVTASYGAEAASFSGEIYALQNPVSAAG